MKFAIRKLALACVVPTTMLVGISQHVQAQDVSTTAPTTAVISAESTTLVRPVFAPPKLIAPDPAVATPSAPQRRVTGNRVAVPAKPGTLPRNRLNAGAIQRVANQVPQAQQQQQPQQQQQSPGPGGETDVQKQLRMLYEKSGQEMPVMDLDEMVVPEPQAGVAPGTAGPGNGQPTGGAPGMPPPGMQPPADAAKKPNFFERVFLGKKAPTPPPQQPGTQRPGTVVPAPGARAPSGQPGANYQLPNQSTSPKGGPQNSPNYRPYATNPPAQQNSAGQRPGTNQPGAGMNQGTNANNQQRPQGYPTQQGVPTAQPGQQPFLQPPQGQLNRQPSDNGANTNPEQAPQQQQMQQPQTNRKSDLPVLEDEPEESLEIDLTPRAPGAPGKQIIQPKTAQPGTRQQGGRQAPLLQANPGQGVIPAPLPTQTSPLPTGPTAEGTSATVPGDENPFSGLRLTIPESAPQRPAATQPTTPPATTPNPASSAVITPLAPSNVNVPQANRPLRTTPAVAPNAPQSNGTFGGGPAHPTLSKSGAHTIPAIPVSKQSAPGLESNPFLEPAVDRSTPLTLLEENLRKLAEAPEKLGFKGFCPVMLRQHRTLANVKPQFNSLYQGKKYRFSSADTKAQFEKSPQLFVPAHDGLDGVAVIEHDKSLEGSLDFAAWYRGRLYLFASRENLELFNASPDDYVDEKELDATLEKALAKPGKMKPNGVPPAAPAATLPRQTPARQPAAPNAVTPPTGTRTRGAAPKAKPMKAPVADDLPVLSDNIDAFEPIAPQGNVNGTNSPAQAQPNVGTKQPAANGAANSSTPKTIAPQPINATPPKAEGAKPEAIEIEGPKLQGPKLNALSAPIKPASGVESQRTYPAPRLINPPPKLVAPAVQPGV
jgi:YHS domain-containing protein